MLAQPELHGVVVQPLNTGQPTHLVEEVVARHGNGLRHIHSAVGAAVGAIDPASGLGKFVIGVDAPVHDGGGGSDDAGLQSCHGGA